jgi:hypothetical protein
LGLYRQPNDWTCGPFALKHALVTLGRLADENSIAQVAHPHWWAGTDEVKLARAARHFDCDLPLVRRTTPDRAFEALSRYVDQNLPVILCVDEWGHWVTVVRRQNDRFVIIDSKDEPVLKVLSWRELSRRWGYTEYEEYDEDTDSYPTYYDLHPVKPRYRVPVKAHFSVERAQHLRRPENADLAIHWDEYLGDLMEICRPRRYRGSSALSMGEFLRRNQELLVSRIRFWHGHVERAAANRVLKNFRFVAETYGLVIPAKGSRRALVDMTVLLSLWAAASNGVGAMYGSGAE